MRSPILLAAVGEVRSFGVVSMSDSASGPEFTPRGSLEAKLKLAARLIETASQQLRDGNVSTARRAELQKIVDDTRKDLSRFQKQKEELDSQ